MDDASTTGGESSKDLGRSPPASLVKLKIGDYWMFMMFILQQLWKLLLALMHSYIYVYMYICIYIYVHIANNMRSF